MPASTIVIVGAGLAGARAAEACRQQDADVRILLIGEEPAAPYDRVTLSKHFLYREPGFHGLYLHDDEFYRDRDIELKLRTPVSSIDARRHDVVLGSGKRIRYDALLLATGAEPRRWRGRGADLAGVHYLRGLDDAERLRSALEAAAARDGQVVVIGGGWIGCEVAAAARHLGLTVDLVMRGALPLQRQVGDELARFFRDLHVEHGVTLHPGAEIVALDGPGTMEDVVLSDGSVLPADVVIVGIGAEPCTALAASAGATLADGIVTDEYFATDVPGIFAAGDCASVRNLALNRNSRPGHYSAAFAQGPAAARAMIGAREPYRQIPFFFSDQYDMWMEYTGDAAGADDLAVRTLPGRETFIAFWLKAGTLVAGMNVNIKGVPDRIRALIAAGARPDPAALRDPGVPLERLAPRS